MSLRSSGLRLRPLTSKAPKTAIFYAKSVPVWATRLH
jgi:hypothetical protein